MARPAEKNPESIIDQPIQSAPGVGPARAREFRALGLRSLGDLLEYFPRDYVYESAERGIGQLIPDQLQTARGQIVAVNYIPARPRPRFEATLDDGSDVMSLVWFNAGYVRRTIHPGQTIRVKGPVKFFRNIPGMINPKFQLIEESAERMEEEKFRPIYPATANLPSDAIARTVDGQLDMLVQSIEEWISPAMMKRRELIPRRDAYRLIHRPADLQQAKAARRRLVYDELMLMQLGLGLSKQMRAGRLTAPAMRLDKLLDGRIRGRFPFALTPAQERAVYEIAGDLKKSQPMNRLLQGDVGSGKTVVALYAMLVGVANKLQSALLAPTEVLAEQHYLTLRNMLAGSSVNVALCTYRSKKESKGAFAKQLTDGRIHIAVGTQALLGEEIEFANLGLVVVDEQHKLGVRQRGVLKNKGLAPHYLVMTATPIPRTLALSYFADFDVSTIDELPPGRQPIVTKWLKNAQAGRAYDFIREQVGAGRQAYIVLPQIDDDGIDESKSVRREFDRLSKGPLSGLRLSMLHGQMSPDEKQAVMASFRAGQSDVLVATTVIEVGIDVPNATVMLIGSADSFGLSQLHQLRGRVGRGEHASHCLLLADAESETAEQRMKAMTRTANGFEIAEMDLQMRGPGEFFGTRQHGLPEFKVADITREIDMLRLAKEDALEILRTDPKLAGTFYRPLRLALQRQFGDNIPLAQIG